MYCIVKMNDGQEIKMDLTDELLNHIFKEQEKGNDVPIYATTYQKRKFGDAVLGIVHSVRTIKE